MVWPFGLAGAGGVRLRIELRPGCCAPRVDAVRRNDVSGERLSGRRIVDRAVSSEKSPRASPSIGTVERNVWPCVFAVALVVGEEEGLVLEDRAAERAAELVLLEIGLGAAGAVVEEVVGVERVVAVELEAAAVEACSCRT